MLLYLLTLHFGICMSIILKKLFVSSFGYIYFWAWWRMAFFTIFFDIFFCSVRIGEFNWKWYSSSSISFGMHLPQSPRCLFYIKYRYRSVRYMLFANSLVQTYWIQLNVNKRGYINCCTLSFTQTYPSPLNYCTCTMKYLEVYLFPLITVYPMASENSVYYYIIVIFLWNVWYKYDTHHCAFYRIVFAILSEWNLQFQ